MYYIDASGKRVYTLQVDWNNLKHLYSLLLFFTTKKMDENGIPTSSAHPARFSPDDKFSKERITCKRRFNILPTQVIV